MPIRNFEQLWGGCSATVTIVLAIIATMKQAGFGEPETIEAIVAVFCPQEVLTGQALLEEMRRRFPGKKKGMIDIQAIAIRLQHVARKSTP